MDLGQDFLSKANEAFVDEDHETALSLYTKAISLSDKNDQAYSKRAFCNYVLENYEDCVSDAAHCLSLNPDNSKALLRKGMGFLALEQHRFAKDCFLEGETRFPSVEPWLNWVKKCEMGDEDECMTISDLSLADKAKKFSDDEPVLGWSERGPMDSLATFSELTSFSSPMYSAKRPGSPNETAEPFYLAHAKMSEEEREAEATKQKELGNKCYLQHDYEEAIEHYTKAIYFQPDNYLLYTNRASAYYRDEQLESALDDALKSIKINSQWSKGHYRAGVILIQLGKHQEGLTILRESLSICPGGEGGGEGKSNKDIEKAIELGEVFLEAFRLGFSLRMVPVNGRVHENVFHNRELLSEQKFGELATAVTMTVSPTSTRCVRQAFVDQMGKIVSLESSVSDQTILSRLNSGEINQIYVFVVVTKEGEGKVTQQKFSYKEPRPNSGETNFEIYPLSVLQLDVLDLTLTLLAREPSPNLHINRILKC